MENLSQKSSLSYIKDISNQSAEQSVETQINLPDYCGDIRKILKCFVVPNIFACSVSGDRATADGEALIKVFYLNEASKPECYEQTVPFSKYIEIGASETDCIICAAAKTEYVNCRAVSQRKITVSANISIRFRKVCICHEELFSPCDEENIEKCDCVIDCTQPVSICEKMFEMSETGSLSENLPAVSSIIYSNTYAVTDSIKTVTDKMLIKGEMITDIIYTDEESSFNRFRHSMPISQICDLEGADENSISDVSINILSSSVNAKADPEGNNRYLDICVKGSASVKAYSKNQLCVVEDVYSTENETDSQFKNLKFRNHLFNFNDSKKIKEIFEIGNSEVLQITDAFAIKCDTRTEYDNNVIKCFCEIPVGIIYINKSDETCYIERMAEMSFECRAENAGGNLVAFPSVTVTSAEACLASGKAEVMISLIISMPVFEETEKRVCTKLEILENEKKKSDCPLIVYFASEGEKIWNIAKEYNSTIQRIKEDNDLKDDIIKANKSIIISVV